MKKLILILVLLIAGFTLAQTTGKMVGDGMIWSDSLTTYSAASASDSVYEIDMNYAYSFPTITIVDTGSVFTDSTKLYKGRYTYVNANNSTKVDTIWDSDALPVKVGDWSNDTTLVANGKTKTYVILDPAIRLLRVLRVNAQVVAGTKTDIIIEAIKQR